MSATREQLESRWETPEGRRIARAICTLLEEGVPGTEGQYPVRGQDTGMSAEWPRFPINVMDNARRPATVEELQRIVVSLPFQEEVAPALDLRGLHLEHRSISFLLDIDLSLAHLEYVNEIGSVGAARMVGTVFNQCRAINALFIADFTSASFVQATLQGVRFIKAILVSANFSRAKLALAHFREADCINASFHEADMRFTDCTKADFRGANLAGADLTEANLYAIKFDEKTRLQGANLCDATLDEAFRTFAEQSGALLSQETEVSSFVALTQAQLAATIEHLKRDNTAGHFDAAVDCLIKQSQKLARDPEYPWSEEMHKILSPAMEQEVIERYAEVQKTLAYYL